MNRCPLCAGTGQLAADAVETTVNELADVRGHPDPWQADLRRLLKLLHQAVIDHDSERRRR